jgi:folate-binding protein YgfZ
MMIITEPARRGEPVLRALEEAAGARFAEYFGLELPEHFGDAANEYAMARESVTLLDTNYRSFLYLDGPDRVRYLNAVTSCNIKDLAPGQGTVGLLLNPQGHILAELECYTLPERLLVRCHARAGPRTVETLDKYIIMDDVTMHGASAELGSVAVEGPKAPGLLAEICGPAHEKNSGPRLEAMSEFAHCEVTVGEFPCRMIRRSHYGEIGAEFLLHREKLPAVWKTLLDAARRPAWRGGPLGYAALNVLRLEAGIPWFGYDFDEKQIPHEAALEDSHLSYTKGCYTGQEIVERVRARGQVHRRRVSLQFSGTAVPRNTTPLLVAGKEVGYVTSAAHSPALGRVIGMGYLRREHQAPGSRVDWEGGSAEVVARPGGRFITPKAAPPAQP